MVVSFFYAINILTVILPKVYKEFFKAWEWYDEIQEGLGDRFRDKVFRAIHRIADKMSKLNVFFI